VTKPDIDLVITHDFLDDSGLVRFLAGNTVNAFLYEDQKARGISSCTDYAVASGRPLAISRSSMFRNLHEVNPSICIEDCSLQAIAGRRGKELAPLRATCSYDRAGAAWESAMLDAVDRLGISRSVPDGRGFNKILDDSSRQAYGAALRLQEKLAPEILSHKVARANIQQAFALDIALRLLPEEGFARILAIGSFEDTAVATLKAMGYLVDEIDPNVNGVDLDMFYRSPTAEMSRYDLILCVSVLEHVTDDQPLVRMAVDLLAPNGIAVFTVDFAEDYVKEITFRRPINAFTRHGKLAAGSCQLCLTVRFWTCRAGIRVWKISSMKTANTGLQPGFSASLVKRCCGVHIAMGRAPRHGSSCLRKLLQN
jgi:SAM-dependent methyltransferase